MQEVTWKSEKHCGLTLVELMISLMVVGLIGSVIAGLTMTGLDAYRSGQAQAEMQREAAYAMNRMVQYTRNARFVFVPNGRRSDTDMLAVAAGIDTDGDGRIDEDSGKDLTGEGIPGVPGVDDDGDGEIDEGSGEDDDEDGDNNEDKIDGVDNDGDGSIDEDPDEDWNKDGKDGIKGFDDDDDGAVDEGDDKDEDEDGTKNEDPAEPIIFYVNEGTLMENHPVHGVNALAHDVAAFRTQYLLGSNGEPYTDIVLTLSRGEGCEISLSRQVHMENILQRQGMAVQGWQFGEDG
jgi:prepilin-type N-terminal cleavage/methylation domain-containing protein